MYRIVNWIENFENNRTKELKKLSWVPFPNKHDGDGYTELLDHPDGAAHYGAWCAIVQVASKCDERGTLLRDGARPHDARTLARMTRIPEPVMAAAIDRLINEIHWLEVVDDKEVTDSLENPALSCGPAALSCGLPEQNRTEGNGTFADSTVSEIPTPADFSEVDSEDVHRELATLSSRVPEGRGDRAFLVPVAFMLAANVPIRPLCDEAIGRMHGKDNPVGYLRTVLKNKLGTKRLNTLIAMVPKHIPKPRSNLDDPG